MGCTFELMVVLNLVQSLVSNIKSLLDVLQIVAHAITGRSFLAQLRFQLLDPEFQRGVILHICKHSP